MARYPLNLPTQLKQAAERHAADQGVSLNQFILWSVAEKVSALEQRLDDPAFPLIGYRRGASGIPQPVVRGTGIRVQTLAIAAQKWQLSADELATEYSVSQVQAEQALAFYQAHRQEIDLNIAAEELSEAQHAQTQVASGR